MEPCRPLACSGYDSRLSCVCISDACKHVPFMCVNETCQCHEQHRGHIVIDVQRLFDRCNHSPKLDQESCRGIKPMKQMLNELVNLVESIRQEHQQLTTDHPISPQYRQIKDRLVAQDGSYDFTGSKLHNLLQQIEETKPPRYPYWVAHEAILERLTPQILHLVQQTVRSSWRFSGVLWLTDRKVKVEEFKHLGGVMRKLEACKNEEVMDWSVRAVVLDKCTSDDWPNVLKRLSQLQCVTGVQLSHCNLEEKDLTPLLAMEHLEKMSLDYNKIQGLEILKGKLPRLRLLSVEHNIINEGLSKKELIKMSSRQGLRVLNLPAYKQSYAELGKFNDWIIDSTDSLNDRQASLLLTNHHQLKILHSGASPRLTASTFKFAISRLDQLKELRIAATPFTVEDLSFAKPTAALINLHLIYCQLNNKTAKIIAKKLPHIQQLHLQHNNIGPQGLEAIISGLPKIRSLFVGKECVTQEEMQQAIKVQPHSPMDQGALITWS